LAEWFRRFGDIPGVSYDTPEQVDRNKVAGHDTVPKANPYRIPGQSERELWWPTDGTFSSASPVHRRAFADLRDVSTAEVVRHVYEGLELPGVPTDYHFLSQGCAEQLRSRSRQEPSLIAEVEKLSCVQQSGVPTGSLMGVA
jgi:hypothetical protein